jgi:NitT/TauT family transport system ATP-binding protein
VKALEAIDLDIYPGEFVALLGPSGCGKSTLLRLVGDLISPSTGTLQVNGKSAHQARLDRDYGIVFQQATLYEWRTIRKNVQLPLEVMNYSREKREARTEDMLRLVQWKSSIGITRGSCPAACSSASRSRAPGLRAIHSIDGRAVRGTRRDDARAYADGTVGFGARPRPR